VPHHIRELVRGVLNGNQNSLAQLISLVENNEWSADNILDKDRITLRKIWRSGITGPPGAGKSTLLTGLVKEIRGKGLSVGIIAVDPSSAVSGGAVLGDRIRMQQCFLDRKVFIRSVATRGSYGGLSKLIPDIIRLLEAFGKDIIMVETAGVGQSEVAIKGMVDTVIVVLTPEGGDSIQFMKAGLIEIADIVVVNKSDRVNADIFASEIMGVLSINRKTGWQVPVINTQAINGIGIESLYQEIEKHQKFLEMTRQGSSNMKS
jgi:LAO/AO transport system kinase